MGMRDVREGGKGGLYSHGLTEVDRQTNMGSHHQTYFQRQLPGRVPAPHSADAEAPHTSSHGTRSSGMGIRQENEVEVLKDTIKVQLYVTGIVKRDKSRVLIFMCVLQSIFPQHYAQVSKLK